MTIAELLTEIKKGEKSKLNNSPVLTIDIAPLQRLRLELEVAIYGGENYVFNIRYEEKTEQLFFGSMVISMIENIQIFKGFASKTYSVIMEDENTFICECDISNYEAILSFLK